jgi:hypothetical protein
MEQRTVRSCSTTLHFDPHRSNPLERTRYFASFPREADIPIRWPKRVAAELFRGTELEGDVEHEQTSLKEDYNEIVAPLLARHAQLVGAFSVEKMAT